MLHWTRNHLPDKEIARYCAAIGKTSGLLTPEVFSCPDANRPNSVSLVVRLLRVLSTGHSSEMIDAGDLRIVINRGKLTPTNHE